MLPEPVKQFVELFSKLPSLGIRQAIRLAFALINSGHGHIEETTKAVAALGNVKICSRCFFVYTDQNGAPGGTTETCAICRDKTRNQSSIMIVEKETDLISLERPKKFKGRYLILGELSKNGVFDTAQKLRISNLKHTIEKELGGAAEEIIIATNPTTYGDLHASILAKELANHAKKISRLGRGIPTGGEIEFADEETLESALERRN